MINYIDICDIKDDIYGFIYITTNTINGMRYIGQKNIDKNGKWKKYLGSGVILKRAISKYGKEHFRRDIIDVAKSADELNKKEIYWIEKLDAVSDLSFYNIAAGGEGGNVKIGYSDYEYIRSEVIRIAKIKAAKDLQRGELCASSKLKEAQVVEIIQCLLNNERPADVATRYGVSVGTIKDIKSHKTWRHLTMDISFPDCRSTSGRMASSKRVDMFTKNMEYIKSFDSAREAEKETGIGFRLISQVCNGEKKTTHGYIFKFSKLNNE